MRFIRRAASAIIVASIGLGLAVTTAAAAPSAPPWAAAAGAATSCVRVSATIPVGGSPTWVAANPNPLPIPMTVSDPTLDMHAFLVTRWEGEPVNAAPEEHDDLRWFRPSDLADLNMADPASLPSILSAVKVATN